jgi:glyceraldehyde 3-phosphate dehydrogenase
MATKTAINGFGRIGRQVLRACMERHPDKIEIIAVNDLTDAATNAHLFKYDTNYGVYPGEVKAEGDTLKINGAKIQVVAEKDPAKLPWKDMGVELVIESTGFFTDATKASAHLEAGAKKVIISAPAKNEDLTVVIGVNDEKYDPNIHHVLSNASCTTNCVAPLAKVIYDNFGIKTALMSTIHSYTNDQKILDQVHTDLRRARAASMNIIPTSTGAAKAVGIVMPELNGKIHGVAFRVPTPTGSATDLVVNIEHDVTPSEINEVFRKAAEGPLKGILEYTEDPIVSSDIKFNPHSCVFDSLSTIVIGGSMIKVLGWYDNEWGYSCRTADLAAILVSKGIQ